jgi:hypothetical protein
VYGGLYHWSLRAAGREQQLEDLLPTLRDIEPDLSGQYSRPIEISDLQELKMRLLHAFQCRLMLKAIEASSNGRSLTVVDIGDSAGTHMKYLRALTKDRRRVEALSVNLDARAVEKIRSRGGRAMLCRAEEIDLGDGKVDLFTTFEMAEHLHNPARFFRRLAKYSHGDRMAITVPYRKTSRVGLSQVRQGERVEQHAEDVHIFELSPDDWSHLLLHAGWKVEYQRIYYQYPRRIPLVRQIMGRLWRRDDFEGFWGAIVTKDLTFADCYKDWED